MKRLVAVAGPDQGRVFALTELPVTIGRGFESEIRLTDTSISRAQARIETGPDGPRLVDLNSTNGTRVNGKLVSAQTLHDGDQVSLGTTTLAYEGDSDGDLALTGGAAVRSVPGEGSSSGPRRADERRMPVVSDEHTLLGPSPLKDPAAAERAHRALLALYRVDTTIGELDDAAAALDRVLALLLETFRADRAAAVLLDARSGEMSPAAVRTRAGGRSDVSVSRTLLAEVLRTREAVLSQDAPSDERFDEAVSLVQNRVRSLLCAPLVHRGKVFGALYADILSGGRRFGEEDLRLLSAIASKVAAALANASLHQELRDLYFSTIEAFIEAIQMKDPYTRGHSERVRRYSLLLAREIGLPAEERRRLHISAVLHDVGKIGMPDRLLFNTDELTAEERVEVQRHPVRGADFLQKIPLLRDVITGVKYHHENWDGTGYPDRLKGEAIPVFGRIVAVADTYDAVTTERPYQKAVSKPEGLALLRKLKGTRLDPKLVDAFIAALGKEKEAE
ncbi:MAG: HD domain-containing protein [Planctomycetales bacterium]|nr:HD domain-containing protein [Planctomycetales bacterium]